MITIQSIYDVVSNTFKDRNIKLLNYNIDMENSESEVKAFWKMGKLLCKKKSSSMYSYLIAKYKEKAYELVEQRRQEELLNETKIKVLLVAHRYNIGDKYIGLPIMDYLQGMGVIPIIADITNKKEAIAKSEQISTTLPWTFNRELVGSVAIYKDKIDGIILISSFPCGPDSLVNEIILRRVKDKPILNLILDGQEGSAGVETRLESFIDIIKFKKDDYNG